MIDLSRVSALHPDDAGIWRPASHSSSDISFPEDGHDACFAIENDSFWYAHRNACITAALRQQSIRGPVLDIGGGNGAVSQALERAGIETVLLEPGDAGARNARRRGLASVACATLEEAQIGRGSFAAAGLFDVIEHVEDDVRLLRDTRAVLSPGGSVCVTVPAFQWLWSDEDEVAGHYRRYTRTSLRAALEQAGFAIVYETYLFAALVPAVFAMRSLPHRLLHRSTEAVARGAEQQHVPNPWSRRVMDAALRPERHLVELGRSVPVGTSCLAIAVRD